MSEEEIIKRAKYLYINEYPKDIRKSVEQSVNELATAQDICEMASHLGCSVTEFIDDICNRLLNKGA